jgi:predicted polyphosphate/ATP-dependent NAD kinase
VPLLGVQPGTGSAAGVNLKTEREFFRAAAFYLDARLAAIEAENSDIGVTIYEIDAITEIALIIAEEEK